MSASCLLRVSCTPKSSTNQHSSVNALGLRRRSMIRKVRRQLRDNELLNQIGDGSPANPDSLVLEHQPRSAILRWVVKIRDTAGSQAPENPRIIELPASVVTFANHCIGDRVQNPRPRRSGSLVEITRILFHQCRQQCSSQDRARNHVGVGRAVALSIPLSALPIFAELIFCLLPSAVAPVNPNVTGSMSVFHASSNFCFGVNAT